MVVSLNRETPIKKPTYDIALEPHKNVQVSFGKP